jgi:hypothetical protein
VEQDHAHVVELVGERNVQRVIQGDFKALEARVSPSYGSVAAPPSVIRKTTAAQPGAATSTCSIDSAKPSSRTPTMTPLIQTSSSAVSNLTGI